MNVFERYLTVWVFLCIIVGVVLGQFLPSCFQTHWPNGSSRRSTCRSGC